MGHAFGTLFIDTPRDKDRLLVNIRVPYKSLFLVICGTEWKSFQIGTDD